MPRNPRDYKKEYAAYQGTAEQKKKRAARGRSRTKLKNAGVNVAGKDVTHKNGNANDTRRKNLGTQPASKNRSFKRTKTARKKNPKD